MKFKNIGTYIEISRKIANINTVIFIFLLLLTILNYITLFILKYYDFKLSLIGKPFYRFYYSPFLFLKVKNDNILLSTLNKKLSLVYVAILFIFLIFIYIAKNNKEGLLGSARFATVQEVYEKGFISIGNDLNDGLILGRIPFKYTIRSFLFILNFPLFMGNIMYIFTPNFKKIIFYSLFAVVLGIILILISDKKMTIIDNTNSHTALIAQSRSGKGVGVIIPSALNWHQSFFAFDIKKEIYTESHIFREKILKNKVFLFEPYNENYLDPCKIRYNPLAEIRIGTKNEIDDIEIIAEILTAPAEASKKDHWTESAKNLASGVILHLAYLNRKEGKVATLGEVYDFLTSGDVLMEIAKTIDFYHETSDFFEKIYDETQLKEVPEGVHPIVYKWANEMSNKRGDEFSDILSSLLRNLSLFKSPLIREATKKSDFKIHDIANGERPCSLYLVVPEEQIEAGGILIKLITTLFLSKLMPKDFINDNNKYQTLAILDETPLFGYIPALERGSGFVAGAKVKLLVVGQNFSQFYKIYGEKNILLDNLGNSIFYSSATTDYTTAEKVSKLLGNKTIEYSNDSAGQNFLSKKWSKTTAKRELMTPDEIINMSENRNLMMLRGELRTIYGNKISYYKENFFIKRAKMK